MFNRSSRQGLDYGVIGLLKDLLEDGGFEVCFSLLFVQYGLLKCMKFLTCWSQYLDYYQVQSQLVSILHDLDIGKGTLWG